MEIELKKIIRLLTIAALSAWSLGLLAQTFPSRPVRIVVPFAAGGPNDLIARIIGQKLNERWGRPIVVDNRSGAGGNIGATIVAKAPPDGHTVALVSTAFVVNPYLYSSIDYDAVKDFAPVTLAAVSPVIIVTHPSFPARDVKGLVQVARDRPVNYGSPGIGTTGHLGAELLNVVAGVKMHHIGYKGAGPAISDLLGGQITLAFTAVPPAAPHIRAKRLNAIAVTTLQRSAALPEVPTVADTGFPGFSVDNMYAVVAPAGTPVAVIDFMQKEISAILKTPDVVERLVGQGFDPLGSTAAELKAYLRAETEKWQKVVKQSGAKAD